MNLIQCKNDHYYDADKFGACPHCSNQVAEKNSINIMALHQNNINTSNSSNADEKAAPLKEQRLVTGWLVCIHGQMKGKSFCLYEGTNYIGRAGNMDIALTKEPTVSRDCHAQIVYDKHTNHFSFSSDARHVATTSCNNVKLKENTSIILQNRDVITIGDCTLTFIPFCDKEFSWYNKE